jgi:penicillin-binding protein-related factor A (putative recombinase)
MVITYKDNSPAIERVSLKNLQEHNIDFETRSTMVVIKEWSVPTFLTIPFFSGFDELYMVKTFDFSPLFRITEQFHTPACNFEKKYSKSFHKNIYGAKGGQIFV